MWAIRNLSYRPAILDFSSSGQAQTTVTALFGGDVCLANALSLMEFEGPNLQVQICEDCGIAGCSPRGWLSFSWLGSKVLWLPCYDAMEAGSDEYAPPRYRLGTPTLSRELYESLSERVPGFPRFERLPELSSRQIARVLQNNAPCRVLGRFPEKPRLDASNVVATGGERDADVAALESLLDAAFVNDVGVKVVPGQPIPFFLAIRNAWPWSPLAIADDQYLLCVADEAIELRVGTV